jgi:hypothetical protein
MYPGDELFPFYMRMKSVRKMNIAKQTFQWRQKCPEDGEMFRNGDGQRYPEMFSDGQKIMSININKYS